MAFYKNSIKIQVVSMLIERKLTMLPFKYTHDAKTGEKQLLTSFRGKALLTTPQLNKSTAFDERERRELGLLGKLPLHIENLDQQVERAYQQCKSYKTNLKKNIYLNNLHDKNQMIFYKLVSDHIDELMPVIYTPIVGTAVKQFSQEFRQPRGIYIAYPEREHIEEILDNRSNPEIDIIVVSDGEGVLGIGDQGIGGMDIPVAKLMVYSLCGGIDPNCSLPIFLDVGTNNQALLDDPMYLGWRHKRIKEKAYDKFIDQFVAIVEKKFPNVFLHWEDLGRANARRTLDRFQHKICTFNDDIQGTGAVTLAALLSAVKVTQSSLIEQRIVVFGAGTAGTGITDQICAAMQLQGLSAEQARQRFWLIDRQGLLCDNTTDLTSAQKPYARQHEEWPDQNAISLFDTIANVKPTVLIGCLAVSGAFTKEIIQEMVSHVERPIILPLSNPTERSEAHPLELLEWTKGKALIATGSPFGTINYQGKKYTIPQCNNALVFPGIGLGVISIHAKYVTDTMLWQACNALAGSAPIHQDASAPLLPDIEQAPAISKQIAYAVAKQAITEGLARQHGDDDLEKVIAQQFWQAEYLPYYFATREHIS